MVEERGLTLAIPDEEVRDLLENLLANAPVAVMITDAEGNVIGVNEAHHQLTGLSFERIVNELKMNFRRYIRVVNPEVSKDLDRAYEGEVIAFGEFFYHVEGGPGVPVLSEKLSRGFWINARAFPIKDGDGKVRYVVLLNEDISARKELEGLLFQAQKMETIGTLAGGLAHDFNNILSGVVGYASLLAARLPTGGTDHEAARTILDAADRASTLTAHLLTIARRSVPTLTPQHLESLLPGTVEFLSRTLGPRYPIRLDLEEGLFAVNADRPQVEQVVTNLCLNAKDAMPEGGLVTLKACNRTLTAEAGPLLPNMAPGDYVELSVTDNGVGMSPDLVNRVFEPFFTTKDMGRGTGLGLAVVYGIIKSHHGFVSVTSSPGDGTSFVIYLPKAKGVGGKGRAAGSSQFETSAGGESLEVLVVDDDPMVRKVLCDMLFRLGHRPTEADSVPSATAILDKDWGRFDVLVVDLVMPDRDGFDLVEVVHEAGARTPVLLCTGYSSPEVHVKAQNVSGVRVLPKPFDMKAFGDAVNEAARSD